ncbi:MAG: hypothetical protein ABIG63_21815 [Chloroflexota bacterium]
MQTITISLPENIYQQFERRSRQNRRAMADEVTAAVMEVLPDDESLPLDLERELAQLRLFANDDLHRAAQMMATDDESERMQQLTEKQQRIGLTPDERQAARLLSRFFNRIMLVRAEAAVLLQERGFDISHLGTFSMDDK